MMGCESDFQDYLGELGLNRLIRVGAATSALNEGYSWRFYLLYSPYLPYFLIRTIMSCDTWHILGAF